MIGKPALALTLSALLAGCANAASPAPCATAPAPSPCACTPCAHRSVSGFFQEHLSADAWDRFVFRDSAQRGDLAIPIALGVGAIFTQPLDHAVARRVRGTLGKTEWIGDVGQVGLVAGAIGIGLLAPDPDRGAYEETWNQAEAFLWTFGAVDGLKYAIGRKRPDATDFLSFPSGHTAAAFCAATLIARDKGPAWGLPAYGVAALTGYSRMEARRHFLSDVLTGAAIGTAVATINDALHFGDGSPGEGISSCPFSLEAGTTDDGRPELGVSVAF